MLCTSTLKTQPDFEMSDLVELGVRNDVKLSAAWM